MKHYLILLCGLWGLTDFCFAGANTEPSGTLPVLYVNTKDSKPIESKETYLKAYYWLDNMGIEEYKSIASKDKPDTMQIKGRGNYTWKDFDKKPFRIKLDNKTALMGLKKSKHFALLAHADDTFGFLKNPSGFWFSEHLQMAWTPKHEAVELVLNGQYWGLYFLTEVIRVDEDRVNIVEQPDNCTHADSITGGWLMEIDNYWTDEPLQVHKQEGNGSQIWATLHTPEETSAKQWEYINNAIVALNQAIYGTDKQFADKVDIESAARFYIVQEIMGNRESYHGSCYFYKDMGTDAKWFWGPVWDFGNSLFNMNQTWIYEEYPFSPQNFVGQMNTHDNFHQAVIKAWQHFLYYDYDSYAAYLTDYANHIASAAANDAARWPSYGNKNVPQRCKEVINLIDKRVKWLKTQWGNAKPDDLKTMTQGSTSCHRKVLENNQLLIRVNDRVYTVQGTRVE